MPITTSSRTTVSSRYSPAQFFNSTTGVEGFLTSSNLGPGLAMGFQEKIFFVGVNGGATTAAYFNGSKWSTISAPAKTTGPEMVFVDSGNNFYTSLNGTGILYRIASGSTTFTSVLSLTAATNHVKLMCEDDLGNIYACGYASGSTTIELWKSTDGGLNFTKIVGASGFPGSGIVPNDHLHGIYWDKYRKLLFCTYGDLTGSYIQVSNDYGTTWSSWTTTDQTVGMGFDKDYIYLSNDLSGNHKIYRASVPIGTPLNKLIITPVTEVFNPVTYFGISANDIGICWNIYNVNGIIVAPYSGVATSGIKAYMIASTNQGTNWEVLGASAPSTGAAVSYAGFPCAPSEYCASWNRNYYSSRNVGATTSRMFKWNVFPFGTILKIDDTNGSYLGDGYYRPIKEILHNGIGNGVIQQLQKDYTSNAYLTGKVLIDRNGYTLGTAVSTTPLLTYSDETTLTPTGFTTGVTTAALTRDATGAPVFGHISGSISTKAVSTGTANEVAATRTIATYSTDIVAQPDIWCENYMFLNSTLTGSTIINKMYKSGTNHRLILTATTTSTTLRWVNLDTSEDNTFNPAYDVCFPTNKWVKVKMHMLRSANGRIRVWIDGILMYDIIGINTAHTTAASNVESTEIGISNTSVALTLFYDLIKTSYNDPSQPAAITREPLSMAKIIPNDF